MRESLSAGPRQPASRDATGRRGRPSAADDERIPAPRSEGSVYFSRRRWRAWKARRSGSVELKAHEADHLPSPLEPGPESGARCVALRDHADAGGVCDRQRERWGRGRPFGRERAAKPAHDHSHNDHSHHDHPDHADDDPDNARHDPRPGDHHPVHATGPVHRTHDDPGGAYPVHDARGRAPGRP